MPAMLTRRSLLTALPALGLAAPAAAQVTGTRILPDETQLDPDTYSLDAWIDMYGRPTAKVMLNGKGPYRFMVDTGSTTTVIAHRHVAGLGVPVTGTATVNGTTGSAETPLANLEVLETGAVRKEDIRVAVLPDNALARADGILGADVFAGRRLVFNIPGKVVRVEPSKRSPRTAPERGNMRVRDGLLAEVDGSIGSVPTQMMLDTGAQHCIANLPLSEALRRAHPRLQRVDRIEVFGVTGQVLVGQFITLPKVELKAFSVKDAGAVAADAPIFKTWGLQDKPAMIVGVNLLSRLSSFSIDYGARRFDAELMALIARGGVELG